MRATYDADELSILLTRGAGLTLEITDIALDWVQPAMGIWWGGEWNLSIGSHRADLLELVAAACDGKEFSYRRYTKCLEDRVDLVCGIRHWPGYYWEEGAGRPTV